MTEPVQQRRIAWEAATLGALMLFALLVVGSPWWGPGDEPTCYDSQGLPVPCVAAPAN